MKSGAEESNFKYKLCYAIGLGKDKAHIVEDISYLADHLFSITCSRCKKSAVVSEKELLKADNYTIKRMMEDAIRRYIKTKPG